mgnify:FL=1|tara:strand:+ start:128 stop:445 length:318 start_codon:yes stop_codon:yes gene_type:complete
MTTTNPDYYEKQSAQDSRMAVLETKVQDLEEQLERFKDKDQEELNDRLRKLEKWVWGAGAVIASLVTVFGIYSNVHTVPTFAEAEHKHGSYITTFDFLKWSNITK